MFLEQLQFKYRLCITHLLLLASLFVAVGVGVFYTVKFFVNSTVDESLVSLSHSILENHLFRHNSSLDAFTRDFRHFFGEDSSDFFGVDLEGRYAQIVTVKGGVFSRSHNSDILIPVSSQSLNRAEKGLVTLETFRVKGMPSLRQITTPVMVGGMFTGQVIQVGSSLENNERLLRGVSVVLFTVLPLGALVASLILYFMASSALSPVRNMTRAAASLGVHDLSGRIPVPKAKDQLFELANTFNQLIDRIQDSVLKLRRFTGDVSHEIRTPLAVIKGEAEFALRKPRSSEEYQKALEVIRRESGNMANIIEELLLIARVEGQVVKLSWGLVSAPAFLRQLLSDVRVLTQERHIKVTTKIKEGLNDFEASEGYLLLAAKNILLNAIKHSPTGGEVQIRVETCFSRELEINQFCLTIIDCGEGISEKDLPYIFDPFYRVDTARNRVGGGSGIGLSLAMSLVKMHEGSVEVKSQLGVGSTFKIIIPQGAIKTTNTEGQNFIPFTENLPT